MPREQVIHSLEGVSKETLAKSYDLKNALAITFSKTFLATYIVYWKIHFND